MLLSSGLAFNLLCSQSQRSAGESPTLAATMRDCRNGDDSIVTRAGGAGVSSGRLADRSARFGASGFAQCSFARSRRHAAPRPADYDAASLRSFGSLIGLLPGEKTRQLADVDHALAIAKSPRLSRGLRKRRTSIASPPSHTLGRQQVFDLTEPVTHSFIANGLTVHNCSEYMFLDDTACNLAIAERAHVLRQPKPSTFRYRSVQARRAHLDDRAGNLRADGQLPFRRNRPPQLSSSARWAWATPTWARCSCRPAFRTTAKRAARSAPPSPPSSPAKATPPAPRWPASSAPSRL